MFASLYQENINDKLREISEKHKVEEDTIKNMYATYEKKVYKNVAHSSTTTTKSFSWITNYTLCCLDKYFTRMNNGKN